MKKLIAAVATLILATSLFAAEGVPSDTIQSAAPASAPEPLSVLDGGNLERELQSLKWEQFKSVIQAIPKMKADVDAYGPLGWQFVRQNYATHSWRKSIDRLDTTQKQQLADLIQLAKAGKNVSAASAVDQASGTSK